MRPHAPPGRRVLGSLVAWYRTAPDAPPRTDTPAEVARVYEARRWSVFLSCTLGYALFYTCRLSLSVAKEPLLAEGVFTAAQLGTIGAALKFVYAFGKLTNGVIADHANVRKFLSTGLLLSALLNLALGFVTGFQAFFVLWALNGWFQSMGAAPCGVALTHWFAGRERGTRYGIWCTSHSIGEGFSYFVTAVAVSAWGWHAGFWLPGALCVVASLVLFRALHDRPETEGLPPIEVYKGTGAATAPRAERTVGGIWREQLQALRHPWVWVIALSSALMYVSRYGIDDWVLVFLKREKDYDLVGAGAVTSSGQLVGGLLGSILAGIVSDRFFGGRRSWPTLACGLLQVLSLCALYFVPAGHTALDVLALTTFAFATGGLLVFLGGLTAIDVVPKKAAGAALGVVGIFSYLGAGIQEVVSGYLLEGSKRVVDGQDVYHFGTAFAFWIGSAGLSMLLALTTWNVRQRE
jgi:MFS transporter, OPA family, sugar phosphate sensor protein UhpC